jgi:hypothetical protein
MALDQKIINDITPGIATIIQGYKDHIRLCEAFEGEGRGDVIVGDGYLATESKAAHIGYIGELEGLLISIGAPIA